MTVLLFRYHKFATHLIQMFCLALGSCLPFAQIVQILSAHFMVAPEREVE